MASAKADLQRLMAAIGHRFHDPHLLELALTHRSVSASRNNERLEFLGDSILGMLVAESLYLHFPREQEGRLTRLRASLVRQDSLAQLARELELGSFLRLGSGELKSGGFRRDSILADALEAILGAIYLDSNDLAVCRQCVQLWYGERLRQVNETPILKDPKTRLQEHLQSLRQALPGYRVLAVSGADHDQHFTVECVVDGVDATRGEASSRRHAEQAAAAVMLQQLGVSS